jgi:hypothetical protein
MSARTRLRHLALAAALLTVTAADTACAPYAIVQRSGPPSALQGVGQVAVRFDWSQVSVLGKSEQEYLSEKNAEEQADFAKIKLETDAAILQGLQDNGGGAQFSAATAELDAAAPQVVVKYGYVQTGIYTPVYSLPSKATTRFEWSRDGKVTDVIETSATVGASLTTPSDHQRMEMVGRNIGRAAGKFFTNAQAGK